MDWEELNHGLFTALLIQQIGMSVVLALIIVVAAFTVIATLVMVVLDKKKEIAVMKAMGATDEAILRIFLYQGAIIGFVGAAAGLLLGLFVCKVVLIHLLPIPLDPKVYFISHLPVQVRLREFLVTGEIALAICLEATILPSLYAATLSPAEGFRDEAGSSEGPRRRSMWLSAILYLMHYGNTAAAIISLLLLQMGGATVLPRWVLVETAITGLAGSVCALALLLWKRWALFGVGILYTGWAVLSLLASVHSPWGLTARIVLLANALRLILILSLVLFGMRRQWRYLE
jgi:lipoprotein-releasing system permease protein